MKIRRQQVHKKRLKGSTSMWARAARSVASWPVLVTLLFTLAASLIALYGDVSLKYSVGQRVDQPVRARAAFRLPHPAKTIADRENARASSPSHYVLNVAHIDRVAQELLLFHRAVVDAESIADALEGAPPYWSIDEQSFARMRTPKGGGFEEAVDKLKKNLKREYVVRDVRSEARLPASQADHVMIHDIEDAGQEPKVVRLTDLTSIHSERQLEGRAITLARVFPLGLREPVLAILRDSLKTEPTIRFDADLTQGEIDRAAEAVPEAFLAFDKGQYIVEPRPAGDDVGLTVRELDLLETERKAYLSSLNSGTPEALEARQRERLHQGGIVTLVAFLSIALFVYVAHNRPRILQNRVRTVAFTGLALGTLAASRLLAGPWLWPAVVPELVLAPCLVAGSVLSIVYHRRFSIGAICIISLMVALTLRWDLVLTLTLLAGVVVTGFQLNDVRSRTKIIAAGMVTAVVVGFAAFAGSMVSHEGLQFAAVHSLWACASAVGAAFVVSGTLPFIEAAFGIATPLSLLEWSESRRPLLQLLANEAPGTNQHSLAVSKLADAACRAIGADGLLASVGALYHDIGKIQKAEYFVENQQAPINRHQNLSPTMSLLIIVAHVKDGVEMAREYKLPRALFPFIEEHHGTTVVRYFYHAASEKQPEIASGKHDRTVPEVEFRYPGPKPRSRESAVVMLSDGVEGAVRSLRDPTPGRIEGIVHQIVMDRLHDGQFDDCDITLKDVQRAEASLVKTLCSLYHGRVAYPDAGKVEQSKSESDRKERKSAG